MRRLKRAFAFFLFRSRRIKKIPPPLVAQRDAASPSYQLLRRVAGWLANVYLRAHLNEGPHSPSLNGSHEDLLRDLVVVYNGYGLGMPHGQAHAQAPGCMVMEVMLEEQGALAQNLSPAIDQQGKEKDPKPSQQRTTHPLIGSLSARKLGDRQHLSVEMNEATTNSSTREKAFASGQSLADYCNLKIETYTER